jgi:nucleoid-associated protein YgaU
LFNPDGQPIRAVAKVKFKRSMEEKKRAAKENRKSPDLTHLRKVKAGDTLPLMCYRIYGDPKYYLKVAEINGLGNFRFLKPGTALLFPPIDQTSK